MSCGVGLKLLTRAVKLIKPSIMSEDTNVQAEDAKQPVEETTETKPDADGFVDPLPDLDKEVDAENEEVEKVVEEVVEEAPEPEKVEESKPEERPLYTMPVAKAQEEKKRAVEKAREEAKLEAEAEMQKVRDEYEQKLKTASPKSDTEYDKRLKEVAEKHGLDASAAADLLGVLQENIKMPDMSKYDQIVKEKEIEGHRAKVSQAFNEKVAPLITKDFPQATPEHIREVKTRIEELAFTEGYNTYKLEDIYAVKRSEFEFKNSLGAEPSGGRGSEIVEMKKLSDVDEIALADSDPEAYRKYLKWEQTQESRYIDNY